MDWSNEKWVKLYTRQTAELIAIGWEGRALLWELMRVCEPSGFVDTSDPEELAALCHIPSQHVTACHGVLLDRGIVKKVDGGLMVVNFLEAQTARTSDRERQRRSREIRRLDKLSSHDVTACHSTSQPVTLCHDKREEREEREEIGSAKAASKTKRKTQLPDGWEPTDTHRSKAAELGLCADTEAEAFRDHAQATGRTLKDWDAGFRTWLRNAKKFSGNSKPTTNANGKVSKPYVEPKWIAGA